MNQISVTFSKKLEGKLRQNAKKKDLSISQYIRELVEIGLQVEEAATKNLTQNSNSETQSSPLDLWENSLTWELESRYLLRFLVEQASLDDKLKAKYILDTAKTKAEAFVKGLLKQEAE